MSSTVSMTKLTSTLPPAMEAIVEEVHLKNTNYLTFNRPFSTIGSNGVMVAEPSVLHFGGFEVGKTFKQTLRIVNSSSVSRRIHVITPTTPFFKALCENKRGMLAPGLSEDITVEFTPEQWRYYYDCVRIHCEPENLLVPLHAYPVMNETKFPSRIDFGKCAVGDVVTRRIKMECKVPIEFEFKIRKLRSNPCFRVEPMQGLVPASGHISVDIAFSPTMLRTEEMQLEVSVAEFNSKPVVCSVTGSCLPGLVKDRMLKGATGSTSPDMATLDGTLAFKEASLKWPTNKGGGTLRGGAGGGDAFTVAKQDRRREASMSRDCRTAGPTTLRMPAEPQGPGEVALDGVYFPDGTLTTQSDMSYVLNQQPGKLRIKDIKHAIKGKKQQLELQQEELGAIMANEGGDGAGDIHPLERPEVPAHIKAALFKQLLQQAVEAEKKVVLGSGINVGEDVMTEEQISEMQAKREDQYRQHQLRIESEAMQRLNPELHSKGAMHLNSSPASSSSPARPAASPPLPTGPSPDFMPEWRLLEANDWKKRSLALQRFTMAVHKVVYQQRLIRRLAKMQDFLAQVGYDKERLAEESANPVLLVSESDRPGTAPAKYLKPEMVRTRPLPLFRDVNFTFHGPVEMGHYTDFDELGPMGSKVPLEYQVLGYAPEEYPGLTPYAPPLLEHPLMDGAPEEQPHAAPSSVIPPLDKLPTMPDSCTQMPYVMLEIANRYSEDKVFAAMQPSWGMDAQCAIQPRIYPLHDASAQDNPASVSVRALRGAPLLFDRWLPRRETWQMQLTEEMVPALMSGPDPSDLLVERPDDADKPAITINVPTTEEVARYLPPPSDEPGGAGFTAGPSSGPSSMEGRAAAGAPAGPPPRTPPPTGGKGAKPSATPPPKGGKGTAAAAAPPPPPLDEGAATAAAERAAAEAALVAEAARRRGKQPYELMRQRRQDEVDASKRYAHESRILVLDKRLQDYNQKLDKPCFFVQQL